MEFQVPQELETFLSTPFPIESSWKLCFKFNPSREQWNSVLEKVFGCLSRNGKLELELHGTQDIALIKTELKLCGFRKMVEECSGETKTVLSATKPDYEIGVAVDVAATRNTVKEEHLGTKKETVELWKKLSTSQADEQDLVDENTLVETSVALGSGERKAACAVGRKPCANCTCGKAEKLANTVKVVDATKTAPSSSCGNVSLQPFFLCRT